MRKFLRQISDDATKATLRGWIKASVGEMDQLVDNGFPLVFGKDWRRRMRDFPTAAQTKLLTYVFDFALDRIARRMGVSYEQAFDGGASETINFDCYLFGAAVENKLSLGMSSSSFATGSSHNTGKKVGKILAVKIKSEDYVSWELFACVIDLDGKNRRDKSSDTRWHSGDATSSGFSTLKIAQSDSDLIVVLCGGISLGKKYVNIRYEKIK